VLIRPNPIIPTRILSVIFYPIQRIKKKINRLVQCVILSFLIDRYSLILSLTLGLLSCFDP